MQNFPVTRRDNGFNKIADDRAAVLQDAKGWTVGWTWGRIDHSDRFAMMSDGEWDLGPLDFGEDVLKRLGQFVASNSFHRAIA